MLDEVHDVSMVIIGVATIEAVDESHFSEFRMLSSCPREQPYSKLVLRVVNASLCCF